MKLPSLVALLFVCLVGLFVPRDASAATIQLNCILNTNPCTPYGSSFGTVTLDQVGADVRVSVNLEGSQLKFIDLMLNYAGTPPALTDDDPSNVITYSANGFSINPFNGLFDVGDNTTQQGWNGDDPYTVLLSAAGGLSLADFLVKDSLNGVTVALHIQSIGNSNGASCDGGSTIDGSSPCVPGQFGTGSLKIGGNPSTLPFPNPVPEPSTLLLLGTGAMAVARKLRRRNA